MKVWIPGTATLIAATAVAVAAFQWPTDQGAKADLSPSATKTDSSVGGTKADSSIGTTKANALSKNN